MMKIFRSISVVALVLVSAVACLAGGHLSKWDDWSKVDQNGISFRARCHKLDEVTKKYVWHIEVENRSEMASKIGVAVTAAGENTPPVRGWCTWPVSKGARHLFPEVLSTTGPEQKVRVWLRNFSAEEAAAGVPTKVSVTRAAKADPTDGTVFTACGKEWMVGKADVDWTQTQAWINGLGGGWRAPTRAELEALFAEVGQKCPIGQDYVWAEKKDEHSAWHFSFYYREVRWGYFDDHSRYGRAVAVR